MFLRYTAAIRMTLCLLWTVFEGILSKTHFLNYLETLKMAAAFSPSAIIIGAGPGGIALAYRLRYELGFFIVSNEPPLDLVKSESNKQPDL